MHAEAPAHAPDRKEQVDELGAVGEQLAELVDDQQQMRKRRQRRIGCLQGVVGPDVIDVAGRAKNRLASLLLAEQRGVHAVDQAQVVLQVGDHPGRVWKPRELRERGPALEVDEHEAQLLGAVRRGEARRRSCAAARSCPIPSRRRSGRAAPFHRRRPA